MIWILQYHMRLWMPCPLHSVVRRSNGLGGDSSIGTSRSALGGGGGGLPIPTNHLLAHSM